MSSRNASRTALGVAHIRAAHQLLEASPRVLEDPVAVKILGPGAEQRIRESVAAYQAPDQRGLRSNVVTRSRFAEDRLEASLARGVSQYVILGAGFDTFALRQPSWAQGLRIVEVDHQGTQELKRSMIAAAGLVVPSNLTFATVDFENEPLEDGLRRHSVAIDRPAFFSWLGVTMYLREAAIDATLKSVALFPKGSEIVLTYAPPRAQYQSPFDERAAALGEPWVSFFTPAEIEKKLRGVGFSDIEFLTPDKADRYFRSRPHDLSTPRHTTIVSAIR